MIRLFPVLDSVSVLHFPCQWINRGVPPLAVGSDLVVDSAPSSRLADGVCHIWGKPLVQLLFLQAYAKAYFASWVTTPASCSVLRVPLIGLIGVIRAVEAQEAIKGVSLYHPSAMGSEKYCCVILELSNAP